MIFLFIWNYICTFPSPYTLWNFVEDASTAIYLASGGFPVAFVGWMGTSLLCEFCLRTGFGILQYLYFSRHFSYYLFDFPGTHRSLVVGDFLPCVRCFWDHTLIFFWTEGFFLVYLDLADLTFTIKDPKGFFYFHGFICIFDGSSKGSFGFFHLRGVIHIHIFFFIIPCET